MRAITRSTAVAAQINLPNRDTDLIIPARFLRKPRSADYALFLFHDVRFEADGSEKPEFVLNQPAYRSAQAVVAAENFGCGSSREMGARRLRDPRRHRAQSRRHLPPELLQERSASGHPSRRCRCGAA